MCAFNELLSLNNVFNNIKSLIELFGGLHFTVKCSGIKNIYTLLFGGLHYNIQTQGKSVLLIGLGLTANLQVFCNLYKHATVTVANEHTPNLTELLLDADIVISAAGVAELVKTCKLGAVVVDIGLSIHPTTGKLAGDVCASSIERRAGFYAPRMVC
jgi:5,10-methylene-tetrahydrofolate dehydrogenase/methenyl tetrahydrofolate cyclohydrolase